MKLDFIRRHLLTIMVVAVPLVIMLVGSILQGDLTQAAEAGARRGR